MLPRNRSGYALLSVLMVIVIIGILTTSYMGPSVPGGKPFSMVATDRARRAVTVANMRTAEIALVQREIDGHMNAQQRREFLHTIQPPADGGRYFIGPDQRMMVTTMIPMPLWSDKLHVPRVR
jgi:hypothetical protein